MPRLQEILERAAGQVASPFLGLTSGLIDNFRTDRDDSSTVLETGAAQADTRNDTTTESDEPEAQSERQRISAFMPLSRWMARVQTPGEGQTKS